MDKINKLDAAKNEDLEEDVSFKMDDFASIDYKKPLGIQQDMRTSTYRGTRYIDGTMLDNRKHSRNVETTPYKEDAMLMKQRISNYKANFIWKYEDPNALRNPSLGKKIDNIKSFYECKLKFLKRPMVPLSSVTHSDFLWNPDPPDTKPMPQLLQTMPATVKTNVDYSQPAYTKYIDTFLTTNRVDYCYRSPKDILSGIGANDNITFWTWKSKRSKKVFPQRDSELCDKFASNECVKRRGEFQNQLKHVPHSGLTTEIRENYLPPIKRAPKYENILVRNDITYTEIEPSPQKTEYSMIGSGDRIQKYI